MLVKLTLEDFRRLVRVPRIVGTFAGVTAGILAFLLVRNVLATMNSMDANPGASFWDLFWTTTGTDGETSVLLVAMVWGPIVLLPVILALVVVDIALHPARVHRFYEQYLRDGWVAEQVPTGLNVKIGQSTEEIVVLTGPGLQAPQLLQPLAQVRARVEGLDRTTRKAWDVAVARGAQAGFEVGDLMPELPPRALACTRRRKTPRVMMLNYTGVAAPRTILTMANAPVPVGV